jgi:hypothetical protein
VVNVSQLEAIRKRLKSQGIPFVSAVTPEAGHDWMFWNDQLPRVFASMAEAMAGGATASPDGRSPATPDPGGPPSDGAGSATPDGRK